eukprot:COSAG06_NODE_6366_length_2964_cov_8.087260_3_plen_122_part_00
MLMMLMLMMMMMMMMMLAMLAMMMMMECSTAGGRLSRREGFLRTEERRCETNTINLMISRFIYMKMEAICQDRLGTDMWDISFQTCFGHRGAPLLLRHAGCGAARCENRCWPVFKHLNVQR